MRRRDRASSLYEKKLEKINEVINLILELSEKGDLDPYITINIKKEEFRYLQPHITAFFLEKVLLSEYPHLGIEALYRIGFFHIWIPEIVELAEFKASGLPHKDIWEHTKKVVKQSPKEQIIRWASFFHDIGKPFTRTVLENEEVHFFGHAEVGAKMFKTIAKRLELPEELWKKIHFLILNHLRLAQYDHNWSDSAIRRLIRDMGEHLQDLIKLTRADITTKRREKREKELLLLDELIDRVEQIKYKDSLPPALPKGIGNIIMERFNIPPCKKVGIIKKMLEDAVERGELERNKDYEYYMEWLMKQKKFHEITK